MSVKEWSKLWDKDKKKVKHQKKNDDEVSQKLLDHFNDWKVRDDQKRELEALEIRKDVKDRLKLPNSINTSELALLTGYDVDKLLGHVQNLAEELKMEIIDEY